MKTTQFRISSKLDILVKKISELEKKVIETIQIKHKDIFRS